MPSMTYTCYFFASLSDTCQNELFDKTIEVTFCIPLANEK